MNHFNSIKDTEQIQSKHKIIISQIICVFRQNLVIIRLVTWKKRQIYT